MLKTLALLPNHVIRIEGTNHMSAPQRTPVRDITQQSTDILVDIMERKYQSN